MSVQNNCFILGNIGRVETRYTTSGTPVTSLSIAVNEREKVNGEWTDVTTWFPCTLWQHENVLNYLTVGKQVAATARFKTREYEKDGETKKAYEFVIQDIKLLGGKKEEGGSGDQQQPVSAPRSSRGGSAGAGPVRAPQPSFDPSDDIPFIYPAPLDALI
jgi:single-strand DNA-binding protein